ncbi:hypothetical protein NMG60_11007972 [Bertholletia excelsa]
MSYRTLLQPSQESVEGRSESNGQNNRAQVLDHRHQHQQTNRARDSDTDPEPDPAPPPQPRPTTSATNNSAAAAVRYRECLKNHAAAMGGHVVDGCGEFMPTGEDGTPEALRCAACDCHRNFHRREVDGEPPSGASSYYPYNPNISRTTHLPQLPPPQLIPHHHHHRPVPQPMMVSFGGGGAPAESSSEDLNAFHHANAGGAQTAPFSGTKKRFRTKFTQEQKEKMQEFAEKLGWKIQKQDEREVQQFCTEVGVKRQVFKVWMHNNKQAMKKKQL